MKIKCSDCGRTFEEEEMIQDGCGCKIKRKFEQKPQIFTKYSSGFLRKIEQININVQSFF